MNDHEVLFEADVRILGAEENTRAGRGKWKCEYKSPPPLLLSTPDSGSPLDL